MSLVAGKCILFFFYHFLPGTRMMRDEIMGAIVDDKPEVLRQLLSNGGDVVSQCETDRWKPVHVAASLGRADCLKLVIEAGADINEPCNFLHRSPILHAAKAGHKECTEILLDNGANVNCWTINNDLLMEIICEQFEDTDIIIKVIKAGHSVRFLNCDKILDRIRDETVYEEVKVLFRAMGGCFPRDLIDHYLGISTSDEPKSLTELAADKVREVILCNSDSNLLALVPKLSLAPGIKNILTRNVKI